jgi:hypothetical protein
MYEMGWNREYVFEAFPKIFTQHGGHAWGVACWMALRDAGSG